MASGSASLSGRGSPEPMHLIHCMRARVARSGPGGLCRLLESAAGEHAAQLGVGIGALRAEGKAWVLARLGLRASGWPEAGAEVEIRTWPSRRTSGARAWREFEVLDLDGRLTAEAATIWLMVDLKRRRPLRLPGFLHEFAFPARDTAVEFADAPEPDLPPSSMCSWPVEPAHLDINDHVNNVTWIEWAEAAAGWTRPERLQADFLGEARLGQSVTLLTWEQWDGRRFVQTATAGGNVCVRVQWW